MNDGFIYFIKAGTEFVKIGYTKEVKGRLNNLKASNPLPVSLLGIIEGGVKKEKEIQKKFKDYRIRGEWFDLSVELKAFIDNHTIDYNPPKRKGQHKKRKGGVKYYISAGKTKFAVYLTQRNFEYLKSISKETGVSMSWLVNDIVTKERTKESANEAAY